ncbi:N-acetylmuramoyl-L-alanine amidase family protein [Candidatus Poriferisocius sp.]|uniref:N-acetylmuramoyl-L-alanine amidase family protein n=1 Tax=Candidatus Poriferisocius sp. TaxID=3101276 RepID=UPI003B023694
MAGPQRGIPSAVLTPSGIPVAVLGQSEAGYLIRTPCGSTAEVSAGVPIDSPRVVIDPGHGGKWDTGAVGPNGLIERDLNLKLSRAVLEELSQSDIPAATTRTGDYGTSLSVRAAFADALGADALVSIHHNAPTWSLSELPGTEVFVQSATAQQARTDSARLGGLLYEEITAAMSTLDNVSWSRLPDAGVLRVLLPSGEDTYGMLRGPAVPAALVEYGYLSNPSEAALFATDEYIRIAAKATAAAISAYLQTDRPGAGFIPEPRSFDPPPASIPCQDPALA